MDLERDENRDYKTKIVCPKCKTEIEVAVLQINNGEMLRCKICTTNIDLSAFNPDTEKVERKNKKEWDKLKGLLDKK